MAAAAAVSCTEMTMGFVLVISFSLLPFCCWSGERSRHCIPTCAPLNAPENFPLAPWAPKLGPEFPPKYNDPAGNPGPSGRPDHTKILHSISPTSVSPLHDSCVRISCSDPLTRTPIGSACGCVFPLKVVIDLGIAPILLFPQMTELEIEVAAGTHLKQSQVRIMGADASIRGQEKTTVTIYLVPLGEKFDKMTSLLIYRWFCEKKVPINASIFGDYEAVSVHYPELPSFPPSIPHGTSAGSYELPLTANVSTARNQKTGTRVILLVALSTFLLISLCFGAVLMILNLKKFGLQLATSRSSVVQSMTKASGALMPSNATTLTSPSISTMATYLPSVKTFTLAELEKATDGFCFERILGEGGFGCVYHGILEDESEFAVKMLRRNEQNGDREFIGELQFLSRLHHRNLVKLIGVCVEEDNRGLVYELVRNGSVESHLHGIHRDRGPLNWNARMKIAIGAARALAYLHEDSEPCIIHRDFKGSNILLEEDFTPKVSDFGLAREARDRSHHISTQVMGTFGYVAPEYAMTGHLLVKSDVYSYGVVLLELLTGRKPVYMTPTQEPENLVNWARPLLTNADGLHQLIDPSLRGICNFDDFAKVAAVASMCVHGEVAQRPFMGEVVQALKLVYDDVCDSHDMIEASHSHGGSSPSQHPSQHHDVDRDFGLGSSWWSEEGSPCPNYGDDYSIATAEHAPDHIEETRRPHSTSSLGRWAGSMRSSRSGPLRWKRKKMNGLYRLRGSMSEHGLTRYQFHMNV